VDGVTPRLLTAVRIHWAAIAGDNRFKKLSVCLARVDDYVGRAEITLVARTVAAH